MTRLLKQAMTIGVMMTTLTPGPAMAQARTHGPTQVGIEHHQGQGRGRGFVRSDVVRAFQSDEWRVQSGRMFEVSGRWIGLATLDIRVYDAVTGRFLASDRHGSERGVIRGHAPSGRIVVQIRNRSSFWARYQLSVH